MEFVKHNAATLLEEKELSGETLIKKVSESISNIASLQNGISELKKQLPFDSSEKIYNIIKNTLNSV